MAEALLAAAVGKAGRPASGQMARNGFGGMPGLSPGLQACRASNALLEAMEGALGAPADALCIPAVGEWAGLLEASK
jgi:hypothetical protein